VVAAVVQLQSAYDQKTTLQSAFHHRFWVRTYNESLVRRGRVIFSKPGKMDWVYDDTRYKHVVSDGRVIKVRDSATNETFEKPIDSSPYNALSFLTGTCTLATMFNFQLLPSQQAAFRGYVLIATPKQPTPAYWRVFFYVDSGISQLRRIVMIDAQGNENEIDFANL
jgi:outer membrane lipoprotein-sorting protein